jgi:ankyrin repeat protein
VQDGVKTVELLLDKGARINDADDRGWTPLMIAADAGHGAVIEVLLKRGARTDISDPKGKTALDLANASVRHLLDRK